MGLNSCYFVMWFLVVVSGRGFFGVWVKSRIWCVYSVRMHVKKPAPNCGGAYVELYVLGAN